MEVDEAVVRAAAVGLERAGGRWEAVAPGAVGVETEEVVEVVEAEAEGVAEVDGVEGRAVGADRAVVRAAAVDLERAGGRWVEVGWAAVGRVERVAERREAERSAVAEGAREGVG